MSIPVVTGAILDEWSEYSPKLTKHLLVSGQAKQLCLAGASATIRSSAMSNQNFVI